MKWNKDLQTKKRIINIVRGFDTKVYSGIISSSYSDKILFFTVYWLKDNFYRVYYRREDSKNLFWS